MCSFIKLACGSALLLLAFVATTASEAAPPIKANIGQFKGPSGLNAGDLKVNVNLFPQRRTGGPGGEQRQPPSTSRNQSNGPRPQPRKP